MVKSPKHRMHHINSWNSSDLPVYRKQKSHPYWMGFCFAASFYFSSTTLYCTYYQHFVRFLLLLLPQRYEFSSKSQRESHVWQKWRGCCCYRKGTNFQANHNINKPMVDVEQLLLLPQRYEFSSKSQLLRTVLLTRTSCCCYRKGTNFQANHNRGRGMPLNPAVVVATAKVRIFKQITTNTPQFSVCQLLLLLPQRYEFSSKSQLNWIVT